jgi:hypothetical protein
VPWDLVPWPQRQNVCCTHEQQTYSPNEETILKVRNKDDIAAELIKLKVLDDYVA